MLGLDSVGVHDGTKQGDVLFEAGIFGQAMLFDGDDAIKWEYAQVRGKPRQYAVRIDWRGDET